MKTILGLTVAALLCMGSAYAQSEGDKLWEFVPQDGGPIAAAAFYDGTVYVTSHTNLHALRSDGSLKWKRPFPGIGLSTFAVGADGTVYLPAMGALYAFSPSGTTNWTFKIGTGAVFNNSFGPAIGPDGTVYVGYEVVLGQPRLCAVKPDGTAQWILEVDNSSRGWPVVGPDGTIYLGRGHTNAYAINPDGTLKWKLPRTLQTAFPGIGSDGVVYAGAGGLSAFLPDGSIRWTVDLGWDVDGVVVGRGEQLYFRRETNIFCLNALGATNWVQAVPEYLGRVSLDLQGNVLAPGGTNLFCLNPDGSLRWKSALGGSPNVWPTGSPVVGPEGNLYVPVTDDASVPPVAKLSALRGATRSGRDPWPMPLATARGSGRDDAFWVGISTAADSAEVSLAVQAETGLHCRIEGSNDLQVWSPGIPLLCTQPTMNVPLGVRDPGLLRFYRIATP